MREGLLVGAVEDFDYDCSLGTTAEEVARSCQFTITGVKLRGTRLSRTRARFDRWGRATILVEVDAELVDGNHLLRWLDFGGAAGRGWELATPKNRDSTNVSR